MGWILFNADIENFKSIKKLSLQVKQGFSVITGPNGSGKSNILEAIAFGLGGTPTDMRVKCIGELSGNAEKTNRILVKLSFSQYPMGQDIVSISSSYSNSQRIYYLNNKKVTKSKFDEFILNTLGFASESAYWNISQRAVQNIIIASPSSLFNAVCDVAGTQPLLASKNTAENQIEMSSQQIEVVAKAINELELMVTKDNQMLSILQQKQQNQNDQNVFINKLDSLQITYECAVKYKQVVSAMETLSLLQQLENEIIKVESQLQETVCNQKGLAFQQLETHQQQLLKSFNTATINYRTHYSELQLHLIDQQERAEERKQALSVLRTRQLELVQYREQYLALTTTILPELCHQVSTLQNKIANLEESTPVNYETAKELILERKSKELIDTVDLHRNTELLVVTLTSSATQTLSKLKYLELDLDYLNTQIQEFMQHLNRLREEDNALESQDGVRISEIIDNHQELVDTELSLNNSWSKLQQCQYALHLPILPSVPTCQVYPHTVTSTFTICEGDLGFLADIIATKRIITIDGCDIDSSTFSLALSSLLANNLSVRVCRDQNAALEIMKFSEKHKLEMRIWPLKSLLCYPRHENYQRLTQQQQESESNCSRAIDPLKFLEIIQHGCEPFIDRILQKIAGSWIIVEVDHDVSQFIREKGIQGCITLDGNKHTLGSLTIGSRNAGSHHNTTTNHLLEYHTLKKRVFEIYHVLEMAKKMYQQKLQKTKLKTEISEVSKKLECLNEELCVMNTKTNEQRNVHEAQNKKLKYAVSSLEEIERRKAQLQEDVAALKRVDDFASRQKIVKQQDMECLRRLLHTQKEQEAKASQLCQSIMEHEMEVKQLENITKKEKVEEENSIIISLQEKASQAFMELQQAKDSLQKVEVEVQSMENRKLELQLAQESQNDILTNLQDQKNDMSIHLHKHLDALSIPREKASREYLSILMEGLSTKISITREKEAATAAVTLSLTKIDKDTIESLRTDLVHTKASLEVLKKNERELQQSLRTQRGDYGTSADNDDAQLYSQLVQKSAQLKALNDKLQQIRNSVALLQEDTMRVNSILNTLHSQTYHALRERCRKYFQDLVPDKYVKLAMLTDKLEDGLEFLLYNNEDDAAASSKQNDGRKVQELSGGQKALLGLSFVFAAALHRKRSPLYLLDEVDAALDETNQRAIAKIIAQIFQDSQVICVSHHTSFQDQADSTVSVIMKEGVTVMIDDSITNS